MKKVFVTITALALAAAAAFAQDYNAAIGYYNAGAEAMATDKAKALESFRSALAEFSVCEEEDAPGQVAKCKEIIPGIILSIAKDQINAGEYDAAVATLGDAVSVSAEYGQEGIAADANKLIPNAYMRKGATLAKDGDLAGAIEAYNKVVELKPNDGQTYLVLGQTIMKSGDLDGAIAALVSAYENGQEAKAGKLISNCYLKKAQAALKANKNADAIAALQEGNKYLETSNAYKLLGSAYTKSGKSAEAIEAYKKYLEVDPNAKDSEDILFTIAATAQKSGDKATAKEYYKKLAGTKYAAQAEAQLKTL